MIELGHSRPPVLWIGASSERGSLPYFLTPFSRAIMEVPRFKNVKMPSIDPLAELVTLTIIWLFISHRGMYRTSKMQLATDTSWPLFVQKMFYFYDTFMPNLCLL